CASIAAPLPASSGSTSSTDAPALMSASAWVCMVAALPSALSILNWSESRPVAWKAWVRYGSSYCTYRVEVVVSGRSTPISPSPWEARSVSCSMTEKSEVKDVASTSGAPPPGDPPAEGSSFEPEDEPQAVSVRLTAAMAVRAFRVVRRVMSSLLRCPASLSCDVRARRWVGQSTDAYRRFQCKFGIPNRQVPAGQTPGSARSSGDYVRPMALMTRFRYRA